MTQHVKLAIHACPDCGARHRQVHPGGEARRCEECGDPFVTKFGQGASNRQRFCSVHSGNTAATRRYRARKDGLS